MNNNIKDDTYVGQEKIFPNIFEKNSHCGKRTEL